MNQDTRPGPKPPRIAYIIKCFPRLSETFILHEVLELERQGLPLSIFSLLKPEGQINEAARDVQSPVTYIPRGFPGGAMRLLAAALKRAVKSPRRFLRTIIASLMRYHHPATPRHLFLAAYLANELEQQIRELDLGDRVTLQGAMTHERVITMYAQAAMQALPCIISENGDRDGIPNVLVEAMYMGVPVISTPVSGIPELIRHELKDCSCRTAMRRRWQMRCRACWMTQRCAAAWLSRGGEPCWLTSIWRTTLPACCNCCCRGR